MRRRALLAVGAASSSTEEIFPIHINLVKISSDEYRADPTPGSIALCDYFKKNAVFDGAANWSISLNPGELYIDGIEVHTLDCIGNAGGYLYEQGAWWEPHHNRYDNLFALFFCIYFEDHPSFSKGTFRVINDD